MKCPVEGVECRYMSFICDNAKCGAAGILIKGPDAIRQVERCPWPSQIKPPATVCPVSGVECKYAYSYHTGFVCCSKWRGLSVSNKTWHRCPFTKEGDTP